MTTATTDVQLIHLFNRLCAAWSAGDADGYGACFTEDCDYVSFDGTRAEGRSSMVASHDRLFRGVLRGSALVGEVEDIRYLRPDVALMHATGSVLMPWRRRLPRRRLSRQTIVAVDTPAGWRVAALHNGRVRPVRVPAPESLPSRLSHAMTTTAAKLGIGRPGGAPRSWIVDRVS
jgi:uncharacterized protein (TIGR02246 family)